MLLKLDYSQVCDPDAHYSEIGQARPCTYAFAFLRDGVVYPQHKMVKCRDFLNDTLVWDDEQFTGRIYGYSFAGPYDKEHTTLFMQDCEHLPVNLHLLNEYEKDLGVELTTAQKCGTGLLVQGSPFWQLTTIHLSWYTQVLRVLTYPDLGDLKAETSEQMTKTKGFWELPYRLQGIDITIKRNAPTQLGMHDNNGFFTELTRGHLIKTTYNSQLKEKQLCAVSPATVSSPIVKPPVSSPSPVLT